MNELQNFLRITAHGNLFGDYLYTIVLFVLLIILFKVFKQYLVTRLELVAKKTKTELDDLLVEVIKGIKWPLYFSLGLYFSTRILKLSDTVEKSIFYILLIFLTLEGVRALENIVEFWTKKAIAKNHKSKEPLLLIKKFSKAILWSIAILLILSNLGYNISSLIAGLGIGGIAIALAIQNILTDIFTSFSIYLDKPFQVGDFIVMDNKNMGTVKKIGLKTTRIDSLQGEEIIVSNKDLTEARIHNFKVMKKRRIAFILGVAYETKQTSLKAIPNIIKAIFTKTRLADLDRVHFKEFGEFSLNFEVVYYVRSNEYKTYMDVQQRINLAIKSEFDKKKIAFAYPTQTLLVKNLKI